MAMNEQELKALVSKVIEFDDVKRHELDCI